jgi:hypothetical protein
MTVFRGVRTRSVVHGVPTYPEGWEGWSGCMVQDTKQLQTVAHLAVDFARQFAPMLIQEMTAAMHGEDDNPKLKNWTPELLAKKACDIATALYLEFDNRDWFLDVPGPVKVFSQEQQIK